MFGITPLAGAPFAALGSVNADVPVTGVTGTTGLSSVTVGISVELASGFTATASVGDVTVIGNSRLELTSVTGVLILGVSFITTSNAPFILTAPMYAFLGNVEATGTANVVVTGVSGAGEVGTVDAKSLIFVDVTDVSGVGAVGTVDVTGGTFIEASGLQASGSVGSTTFTISGNVSPSGNEMVGSIGTVSVSLGYRVTGVEATASVGTVLVSIPKIVSVTGVSATGSVQTPLVWGIINDNQTPNWAEIIT